MWKATQSFRMLLLWFPVVHWSTLAVLNEYSCTDQISDFISIYPVALSTSLYLCQRRLLTTLSSRKRWKMSFPLCHRMTLLALLHHSKLPAKSGKSSKPLCVLLILARNSGEDKFPTQPLPECSEGRGAVEQLYIGRQFTDSGWGCRAHAGSIFTAKAWEDRLRMLRGVSGSYPAEVLPFNNSLNSK